MSKQQGGILSGVKNFLFGNKDRVLQYGPLERLGINHERDWQLSYRLDLEQELRKEIDESKDWDKKLALENKYLDLIASFFGHPGDNPDFFDRYTAWKQLYAHYRQGRWAGLSADDLMTEIIDLDALADVVRAASKISEHVRPNEPIVIYAPIQPYYGPPPDRPSSLNLVDVARGQQTR